MIPYGALLCLDTLWFLMIPYDALWFLMMPYDTLWCLMTPHDALWCLMIHYGALLCLMMPYDALWFIMINCDSLWCLMTHYDSLWRLVMPWYLMMPYDTLWCLMTPYDSLWRFVMPYDALWCLMMLMCSPVVRLPEELHVDQVRGLGDALSVGPDQLRVRWQLLLHRQKVTAVGHSDQSGRLLDVDRLPDWRGGTESAPWGRTSQSWAAEGKSSLV